MDDLIEPFVEAMIHEVNILGVARPETQVHTIYFGGGTPSLLTAKQFEYLFEAIRSSFDVLPQAEISLEANPNDLNEVYLSNLLQAGFNRISIGMQSANVSELKMFERQHDPEKVHQVIGLARRAGWENINLDLIFSIPHQSLEDWRHTLEQALSMDPEHISLYSLELKGGTKLTRSVRQGQLETPDDDLAADMYLLATELLGDAGLAQYEISNWAKAGRESLHNLQYWRNLPYLGLGPGAHGSADGVRTINKRLPARYIDALLTDDKRRYMYPRSPATSKATRVDRETEIYETIMMGLRLTRDGIIRSEFTSRFGTDLVDMKPNEINKHISLGLLQIDQEAIRLTEKGRFLSNAVIRDLT